MGMCRQYSSSLPSFLHNRPRMFLQHCTQRLPPCQEQIPAENISKQEASPIFTVISVDSGLTYTVNLSSTLPSCSCKDWDKYHLPCKHMLAVLTNYPGFSWESLSDEYKNCPHFCIDADLTKSCRYDQSVSNTGQQASQQKDTCTSQNNENTAKYRYNKSAIGSRCKSLSSSISSFLHLIDNNKDYEEIYQDLQILYTKIKNRVPSSGGLFTRPVKFGRKDRIYKHGVLNLRKKRRNQRRIGSFKLREGTSGSVKSTFQSQSEMEMQTVSSTNRVVAMDSSINVVGNAEDTVKDLELMHHTESQTKVDEDEAFKLVAKLWQLQRDYNIPVAKVMGTTVTDTDIMSLSGTKWLTDNVLDSYLKMITTWECDKGRKIMHLVTSQVNQIISGTYRPRSFSYKLSEFEMALGVYNRASHWMLLVADISTATLFFYNPVEEHALEMEMVLSGWKDFIEFYIEKTEDSLTLEWTVTSKPHVQQMDSYNCGVFCLIFAEKHLQSASMLHIDHTDLIEMRKKVAMKLMLFEEFLTDCCPKCGCDVKNDEKMQCVSCCRYYHFKEFCIKDDLDELDGASSQFICKLCRIDFLPKERLSESVPLCENMVQWTDKYEVTTKLKQSVKDVDNAIEITFVSDYNKEECAQGDHHTNTAYKKEDVDNSSRHERKMKSKRRSYIYPPIKRVKKTYCLCKRPNDGELYWQCALCKDWFHPECIGMQPDDEPTEYVCSVCEIQPSSETDTPKEGIKNEGEGYEIPEDLQLSDEEEGMEDTFFVCADLACKYLETAITRIQSVLSVAGNASKKPWMVNHYSFRNGCRANKRGFGFSVFSFRAVECVRYHLKKKFFKYDYRGAYQRCGQVIGLRDRKLLKMFDEDIFLAEIYIDEVLLRESLVAILQSITGAQYAEANQECRDVLSKSETKAMKDGLALSAKKKIELEQKYM